MMKKLYLPAAICCFFLVSSCKKNDTTPSHDTQPQMTVTDLDSPSEGEILISPMNSNTPDIGYLYILDKNGKVIQSKKMNHYGVNFKKWDIDGKTRYSYLEYDPSGYHISNVLYVSGDDVVLDENLNETGRYKFLPFNGRSNDQDLADSHDFILLGDNHYITMSYIEKHVTNIPDSLKPSPAVKVAAPIIQEVNNGQVIWEWDATNYPELYASSQEWNNFSDSVNTQDYAHMNSLFIDPKDSNLIVSFRNLNQIVKINKKSGAIMWRLGGVNSDFQLSDNEQFLRQHHATLTDSGQTLLLFDNGFAPLRAQTRIVEMKIDEVNKTISDFKATPVPNGVFTQYMGSAQKRGDTYFIGGGTGNYVMEINRNTGKILFQMKLDQPTYRAFKY